MTELRFDLPADIFSSLVDEAIRYDDEISDRIAASKEKPTTANVLLPMIEGDRVFQPIRSILTFPSKVSENKTIRDASTEAEKTLSAHGVKSAMRHDVYEAVLAYSQTEEAKQLQGEEARYLKHTMRDYRRSGLHLGANERARIEEILTRLSQLSIEFSRNLSEEDSQWEFTKEDLQGLPADVLSSLNPSADGSHLIVTLKYPHVFPIMDFVQVENTRKIIEKAFASRCKESNGAILKEVLKLRAEKAKILGFLNHAQYVLEIRMAENPEKVNEFLSQLGFKLKSLVQVEFQELLDLKREEYNSRGISEKFDGKINAWDSRYFTERSKEKKFQYDANELKKYFPLGKVTSGMLEIYQKILNLKFTEMSGKSIQSSIWHPDVQLFKVEDGKTGQHMGYFYLDLFPRTGKYGHAAVWPLRASARISDDKSQFPVCAMVANFPRNSEEKPSLLTHGDVVTFFPRIRSRDARNLQQGKIGPICRN
eukprot:TRINITY_DN232_c0_g1_i4.p1 TRINITY_DN232_c0_g1~~TRINITY_DN232_c0_g1_i4.p1  ORF type:complete len:481 (+),score=187.39 TRINITY_DN232_c0_g1_i4:384-1826(+)